MLEDSNFDFTYIRLYDIDISREKWLNYLQTALQHSAASDLGLHCSPINLLGVSRLQWVKVLTLCFILPRKSGFSHE